MSTRTIADYPPLQHLDRSKLERIKIILSYHSIMNCLAIELVRNEYGTKCVGFRVTDEATVGDKKRDPIRFGIWAGKMYVFHLIEEVNGEWLIKKDQSQLIVRIINYTIDGRLLSEDVKASCWDN